MPLKKLTWHFYVAVASHRLPGSGRVLSALHCSNSLCVPTSSPWKGLHRTRERAGERGGSPALSSARGGGGRTPEGVAEGTRGGAGRGRRGMTREARRRRRPGIPPQAGRKHFSNLLSHPQPSPADLSLLLNGFSLEHTSPRVNWPRSLSPCSCHPLLLMGYLILPEPGIVHYWRGWLWGFWQREAGMHGVRKGRGSGLFYRTRESAVLDVFRGGMGEEPS